MPMTWQASIAYQFDWNPWIQEIGAQGDSYRWDIPAARTWRACRSCKNGIPTRIGFVPQHRLFLTGGEWVMDALKVAVEYSAN